MLRRILSHPKDKICLDNHCNIVYQIPSKDCDTVYVIETKQMFKQGVQEHKKGCT